MASLLWLEELVVPVVIESRGPEDQTFANKFKHHSMIVWRRSHDTSFSGLWPWFPQNIDMYGIGRESENVHTWFVGHPVGQEEISWRDLILAVGRQQKILTPVAQQMIQEIVNPLTIAVLTTPG